MTKRLLYFVLFFLPLVYFREANQIFELPKFAFFLVFGCGVTGASLLWDYWKGRVKRPLIASIPLGFLLLFGLVKISYIFSWIGSPLPEVSFWGTYLRHGGLVFVLGLFSFLGILLFQSWNKDEVRELMYWVISGAGVAGLSGLVQKVFPDFIVSTSGTYGRVFGTMGHPNFLGQYLLVGIVLSTTLFLWYFLKKRFQWEHLIALGVMLGALLFSWNRASLLALGVVTLVAIGSFIGMSVLKHKKKMYIAGALLVSVILLSFTMFSSGTSAQSMRSVDTRWTMLPSVLHLISDRPIFGYGPDMFGTVISSYYPKELMVTESLTSIPDRAHNELLDTLVETGLFGLFALLLVFAFLLNETVVAWRSSSDRSDKLLLLGIWLSWLALEISCFAGFQVVEHKVLSVTLLFFLLSHLYGGEEAAPKSTIKNWVHTLVHLFQRKTTQKKSSLCAYLRTPYAGEIPQIVKKVTFFFAAVIAIAFVCIGVKTFASDIWYKEALASGNKEIYQTALRIAPSSYEYLIFAPAQLEELDERKTLFDITSSSAQPDYFFHLQKARLYHTLRDKEKMNAAFYDAATRCPNCLQTYYYWSLGAQSYNDRETELKVLHAFFSLLPDFMMKKEEELTSFEMDRKRILKKEQGEMLEHMTTRSRTLGLGYGV